MTDPLTDVISLLQPQPAAMKLVYGGGAWRVRREITDRVFYGLALDGGFRFQADGQAEVVVDAGDFLLVPSAAGFTVSSKIAVTGDALSALPIDLSGGEYRVGDPDAPIDVRMMIGYCLFGSPDASLLVSLLPQIVIIRKSDRLAALAGLVDDEYRNRRNARNVILARLLEVLCIEAFRALPDEGGFAGLVRGLADDQIAQAIRLIHEDPTRGWTVDDLSREAALSRSAFFAKFNRVVGISPMEYLQNWRMSLAKDKLSAGNSSISEIAYSVGYGSPSAFSVAFTRVVGRPPKEYVRQIRATKDRLH
ncbi:cupin domain-containing protein [Pseudosulfitobacter sp. SM2401]|uniref:AraC family transcriptional regulator n=1 Tax=Pseudosulfitobacter sp. SM2401 TaxID=3350098 RepID=UPI0036F28826